MPALIRPKVVSMAAPAGLQGEWRCRMCGAACLVIREESRCLCGHRLKEHTAKEIKISRQSSEKSMSFTENASDSIDSIILTSEKKQSSVTMNFPCLSKRKHCTCKNFYYVVAEGAWILRCRCKHKHTDHDPITYCCTKKDCTCQAFVSPWVCNCNHPWHLHDQKIYCRTPKQSFMPDSMAALKNFGETVREVK
ncbi:hypothetical protein IE077_001716 [Cardiosporidium cionae]|uniref:Protein FAM221A n=1 Tax=Cardiosporidium cionae TaxID=476202 RepID=A0ABQ7JCP6_9APIC|nr:hypothetical protein IE077_001716 [Cardiosporidium cionae]|eukprot:KAF8821700.1 hypothetical protein IE077_001716 [Cardiosporidium cionae]